MTAVAPTQSDQHAAFLADPREHILMLSTHGVHQWEVVPGLPDTGGQNVFVNQLAASLVDFACKITIANRGGYRHPLTHGRQEGLHYKDRYQRILYLEDGLTEFVRKEAMHERIPGLAANLAEVLWDEGSTVARVISHYWDAAKVGALYNERIAIPVQHVWIPHSLGTLKKRNVPPEEWPDLRIDERIAVEVDLVKSVDAIGATSNVIQETLRDDYRYEGPTPFLPPCIDPARYHPRQVSPEDGIWRFLSDHCELSPAEVRKCRIVTEISRTDRTKRKDVLIRAFAKTQQQIQDTLLVVSIDENRSGLAKELRSLIDVLGVRSHVAVVGTVWERLPHLYSVSHIYCTPSIMEGFGMSAQEAAASGAPVVASHLVPFVSDYLLGKDPRVVKADAGHPAIQVGEGAIVVQASDVDGFAFALRLLLANEPLRQRMGENARKATVPYFTWKPRTAAFLAEIGSSTSADSPQR